MAFFKFRKRTDEPPALPVPPESIDVMRKRAKHRLLGAALLVLVGVLGFPLLFDKQPRPIAVDIPIEIPDRAKVKPLGIPAPVVAPKAEQPAPAAPAASAPIALPAATPTPQPVAPDSTKPATKAEPVSMQKPASAPAKADDGGKAQALLDGRDQVRKVDASEARFVVQVGAFADVAKAREVRQKLEHAGLKTYTQVVETKDGRRIRVRVGPFAEKSDADKAADRIKKLNLQAATLSL
ncbi:MAG: SPOR domain-containing protein [Comamonadaceae bacterium]